MAIAFSPAVKLLWIRRWKAGLSGSVVEVGRENGVLPFFVNVRQNMAGWACFAQSPCTVGRYGAWVDSAISWKVLNRSCSNDNN